MRELRCITFNKDEAITAVVERRHTQRHALPAGMIKGLSFNNDSKNNSVLHTEDYDGKRTDVDISEAEMAASLVCYCLGRKIPMPQKSNKRLEVLSGDLVLILTLDERKL